MTDKKTEATENQAEDVKQPSDTKILLAPLGRYALIGVFIVAIIVTTAIMLDNQLNSIDREMASLQTELANANQQILDARNAGADAQASVTETADIAADTVAEVTNIMQPSATAAIPAQNAPVVVTEAFHPAPWHAPYQPAPQVSMMNPAQPTVQTETPQADAGQAFESPEDFLQDRLAEQEQFIAESNEFMKQMDREYLDNFRAYQERALASMREQLARQQQRIDEKEKRYQELYEVRAAIIQRRQQQREETLPERI